ncbi:MAG: hypothetical protein K2L88_04210, partial [Clostridiales bacterium]|nr:hypothetical protein [Clostridiales bacterium]
IQPQAPIQQQPQGNGNVPPLFAGAYQPQQPVQQPVRPQQPVQPQRPDNGYVSMDDDNDLSWLDKLRKRRG